MDYFATATVTASSSSANPKSSNKQKLKKNIGGGNYCCKLSTDPQSVAARERRHRISDRFKILQSLVPGGDKMDTVSMLEQAINYVKFLKAQIVIHQTLIKNNNNNNTAHLDMDHQYRNQVHYNHHHHEDPAASSYFTAHPTLLQADSGSPDLGGSASSYCSHPEACSRQPAGGSQMMFPAPEYFVGHGGEEGMRYYS